MICVVIVIAFILTVLLAPSAVLADDPPDSIVVNIGEGVVIINDEFNIGPPDIGVKTPDGRSDPPEHIPRGT
jgi:hypothetical protein